MKKSGGPVRSFPLAEAAASEFAKQQASLPLPDFSDTEKTFNHLSDGELRKAARLFKLMGQEWLTRVMSRLGVSAVQYGIPGAAWGVRNTIYHQFVGGTNLLTALPRIGRLYERKVTSMLDYGVEAKTKTEDFNAYMKEVIRSLEFSAEAPAAIAAVVKISGIAPVSLLESLNGETVDFDDDSHAAFQAALRRLDAICGKAQELGLQVYIDGEESWIQNTIDQLTNKMMARYNKQKVVVVNTFQMYRHDRLEFLISSYEKAQKEGYLLGAKLVRGAYMVKENKRASEEGYPTPIQPSLEATHADYNTAAKFCLEHLESICCCIGSHNEASVRLMTEMMRDRLIPRNHPHVHFAQLLGMSDNLTFNLAAGGYNVSKYMVYGPVEEVLPYLVRRAQENTSVTGEIGRELKMIKEELARRRN